MAVCPKRARGASGSRAGAPDAARALTVHDGRHFPLRPPTPTPAPLTSGPGLVRAGTSRARRKSASSSAGSSPWSANHSVLSSHPRSTNGSRGRARRQLGDASVWRPQGPALVLLGELARAGEHRRAAVRRPPQPQVSRQAGLGPAGTRPACLFALATRGHLTRGHLTRGSPPAAKPPPSHGAKHHRAAHGRRPLRHRAGKEKPTHW